MENSVIDPYFEYTEEVPQLLDRLLVNQNKENGRWPRTLGQKERYSGITAAFAIRTLAEAELAGLIELDARTKEMAQSAIIEFLEAQKAKSRQTPEVLRNKALVIYDLALLNNGRIPDEGYGEINKLIEQLTSNKGPYPASVLGAHFMLLTLYRTDDARFFTFREQLLSRLAKARVADSGHWPLAKEDAFLKQSQAVMMTSLIQRSFSFPYLYPKLGE
jgi:hypothetical protein